MDKAIIRITAKDISENIPKFETHRDYIEYRFAKQYGIVVHDHDQIIKMRGDSDTVLVYELVATLGKGCAHRPDEARKIVERYDGTAKRNAIQY